MKTYDVTINGLYVGRYSPVADEQHARDTVAQEVGYENEAAMRAALTNAEIVFELVEVLP